MNNQVFTAFFVLLLAITVIRDIVRRDQFPAALRRVIFGLYGLTILLWIIGDQRVRLAPRLNVMISEFEMQVKNWMLNWY